MEHEFKWFASQTQFDELCTFLSVGQPTTHTMNAHYYDTADGLLRTQRCGLRLRQEDDHCVCCLKLAGTMENGLFVHPEYECTAQTITEGLMQLPKVGAPIDLCQQLAHAPLIVIAHVQFTRTAVCWKDPEFTAILSLDLGILANSNAQAPLSEIECEFQSGTFQAFTQKCAKLAEQFHLIAQLQSKLARALSL